MHNRNTFKGFTQLLGLLFFLWAAMPLKAQLLQKPSHFLEAEPSEPESATSQSGFIQVPIRMGGAGLHAVTGFHLYLSYNNHKLGFAGISPGAVSNVSAIASNGILSLQYSNTQAPINCTQTVVLFYINFTRIAIGDVPLTFLYGSQVAGLTSLLPVSFEHGMVLQTWPLNLESSPAGAGVLTGGGEYLPGQSASISAAANPGYYFINWMRDGQVVSTQPDFDFTMPAQPVSLTANFGLNSYMVHLQATPQAGGIVSGSGTYAFGQQVQVVAVPNTGWAFTGWMLDGQIVSTQSSYSFSMPASNLVLWANFEQLNYSLQLEVNPQGAGTVSGAGSYVYNAPVTVQATPYTGWAFTGWTVAGQLISTHQSFSFNMPASALQLQANFEQILYPLQLNAMPAEAGTVSGSGNYTYNAPVTVQAIPNTGWAFTGWTAAGQLVSTNQSYSFNMPAAALQLQANFELVLYPLQLSVNPPEAGTVSGSGSFAYNQQVTVHAVPAESYNFISWNQGGNILSSNPTYTFAMPAGALSLTARFSLKTYTIQVSASHPEQGTVSGGGVYFHGQNVTVMALPSEGFQFIAWTEQDQTVSLEPIYSFVAHANRSLVAVFQSVMACPQPTSLNVTQIGEHFAQIAWVSPSGIDRWDVLWGLSGFDPNTGGTLVQVLNQNFYLLQGLSPQTSYDVYLRAWCEINFWSDWAGPLSFSTGYVALGESSSASPKVFPNPANTRLNIVFPLTDSHIEVEIVGVDGRIIDRHSGLSATSQLDLRHLPEGVYQMRWIQANRRGNARFIILRH